MMGKHRHRLSGLNADTIVPAGVCVHADIAKSFVRNLVLLEKLLGRAKAVNERTLATRAVGVGE